MDTDIEYWVIPVIVYDEVTARETAQVLNNIGYNAAKPYQVAENPLG